MREIPIDKDILIDKIFRAHERFNIKKSSDLTDIYKMLETPSICKLLKIAVENPAFTCYPFTYRNYGCEINLDDRILLRTRGKDHIVIIIDNADKYIPKPKLKQMEFDTSGSLFSGEISGFEDYFKVIKEDTFYDEFLKIIKELENSKKVSSKSKSEIELIKEYLEEELK